MTVVVDVTRNAGPAEDWDLVAEALGEEMPGEIWVDETDYSVTVVECKAAI
jgi:hypothetical protein